MPWKPFVCSKSGAPKTSHGACGKHKWQARLPKHFLTSVLNTQQPHAGRNIQHVTWHAATHVTKFANMYLSSGPKTSKKQKKKYIAISSRHDANKKWDKKVKHKTSSKI